MKRVFFSSASFVVGVLLASHFGVPVAIAAGVGAAIGATLTAVAGKNRVMGALVGAAVISSAVLLLIPTDETRRVVDLMIQAPCRLRSIPPVMSTLFRTLI